MKLIKTFENFMTGHEGAIDNQEMAMQAPGIEHETHHQVENYMFFGDLETIHRLTGIILKMDPAKVDALLKDGHNWAVDHIATSKDDVEEVANFLIGEMTESPIHEGEMKYKCNECGTMYEAHEVNEEKTCSCGGKLEESNWHGTEE